MSAVGNIIKGAGRKVVSGVKNKVDDIFPKADSENMKGIFQRLSGKQLENPDALTHSVVPWQIANKYTVPIAAGLVGASAVSTGFQMSTRTRMGTVSGAEGLSGMTDGGIAGASANVINPYIKQLQDNGSREALKRADTIRSGMQHNIGTSGAEGDIVFALHNMR